MICRKITYRGNFDDQTAVKIFDIARKNEITGEVIYRSPQEIHLNLEGDASFIKLIQHQIEKSLKDKISHKEVDQLPYQQYSGITFIR